ALQGTIESLLAFSSTVEVEVRGMNDAALAAVRTIAAKVKLDRMPMTRFTVWVKSEEDVGALARALVETGVEIRALVPRRETLEDLFVRTVEQPAGEDAPK
ncbi:MAG TPA: DUF4162 domain-containing protein, partial [Chthonomonadaceae bacterium]|nr:DUF4162 domain-containing protein [Chthonomonadaceae bacterium]